MSKLAIYGASGFAREVAWLIQTCKDDRYVVCFIDDDEKKQGMVINNIPVLSLTQLILTYPDVKVVAGVGKPKTREELVKKSAQAGFEFDSVIHPETKMSEWVEVGQGTVICAGNILTTNIRIGEHVQINLSCTIGHDVVLGDYTTVSPGVHISGYVHCGKRVFIGTGAIIINGTPDVPLVIGDDVIIAAGACITKSIPPGQTWGGVPARPLK